MESEPKWGAVTQQEIDAVIDNLVSSYEPIGCDSCGIIAPASDFAFGEYTPEFAAAVSVGGWDMTRAEDVSQIQTMSAGLACKGCGNFSAFDMHPNEFPYPPKL